MTLTVRREEVASLHTEWAELLSEQTEPVAFLHPTWQQVWLEEFQDGRELLLGSIVAKYDSTPRKHSHFRTEKGMERNQTQSLIAKLSDARR